MTREQLPEFAHRAIEAIRGNEPPDDLLRSVMAQAQATKQVGRLRLPGLPLVARMAGALVVLVLVVSVLPRVLQPAPTPSPGPPIQAAPADIGQLPVVGAIESRVAVPPDAYPGSADSSAVWLANEPTGEILRFDVERGQIAERVRVAAPTEVPYDLWPVSDGSSVWVSGRDDQSVVRLDIESMQVADRWPIGGVPYRIAPAGPVVWVTDLDRDRVLQVRAGSGEILTTTEVPDATGIAVSGSAVWVAGYRGDLVRIDAVDGTITARHRIATDATDARVLGDQLWISGINGRRLERFDTTRGVLAAMTEDVTAFAFLDDHVWAAVSDGALVTLDPQTLAWTGAVPLGDVTTDQLVAGAGRLWAYGAAANETFLFGVRPAAQ